MIKQLFSIFLISVLSLFSINAKAQEEVSPYLLMLGQIASYPPLMTLVSELDSGQVQETFSRVLNEYEIVSYDEGLKLVFNQNFVLKEVQFYDSGYLFKKAQRELPLDLDFSMKLKDFEAYKYVNFMVDSMNAFVYHYDTDIVHGKLYFKGGNIELVKFTVKDSFLNAQNLLLQKEWGMRLLPNGICTKGNCFNEVSQMTWPMTAMKYEGSWESGIPHQKGSFSDTTGLSYSGNFKLGFLWGEGVLNVPNSYLYEGDFVLGKRMGTGYARYSNGTWYEGDWYRDLMHGSGHFWFSETYHYQGEFRNNQFNGQGKLTSPKGYVEGSFKNGKPHGFCRQVVNGSQTELSGTWIDGKKQGEFELYNPLTGTTKMYFENDIEIVDGKR